MDEVRNDFLRENHIIYYQGILMFLKNLEEVLPMDSYIKIVMKVRMF